LTFAVAPVLSWLTAAAPPGRVVTWVRVERPTFDLIGVILSTFQLTGILLVAALVLGTVIGASLVYARRRAATPLDLVSLRIDGR
jgi:hypothetical protein